MVKVTWNGKPFNADEFAKDLKSSVQKVAIQNITTIANATSCPVHNGVPTGLTIALEGEEGMAVKLSGGCCDVYIEAFQEKLEESNK